MDGETNGRMQIIKHGKTNRRLLSVKAPEDMLPYIFIIKVIQ